MSNKQKRNLLKGLLLIVGAFVAFIVLMSLVPYTAAVAPAEPSSWQTFVEWNIGARDELAANFQIYVFLAVLIFGGGYFATKGK